MRGRLSLVAAAAVLWARAAPARTMDPDNPTCPPNPNWSANREMRFTVATVDGRRALLGEGVVDDNLLPRLEAALRDETIEEIRLRSPGGNAGVGNQAGVMIRQSGLPTRIPTGWACMGSCAFMFMGGIDRAVEPDGLLIVQMFTVTGDREAIARELARGGDAATDLMTDIARQSARLAAEDYDYMIRMGISRALLTDIVYRQRAVPVPGDRSTRRCLTRDELSRYNVVTRSARRPAGVN